MARKPKMEIFSIFGQCERVAAEMLIDKGKARRIDASEIPFEVARNELGQVACFAVMVPGEHVAEFNKLCDDLRA
jgi:hypothetical protein